MAWHAAQLSASMFAQPVVGWSHLCHTFVTNCACSQPVSHLGHTFVTHCACLQPVTNLLNRFPGRYHAGGLGVHGFWDSWGHGVMGVMGSGVHGVYGDMGFMGFMGFMAVFFFRLGAIDFLVLSGNNGAVASIYSVPS